MGGPTTKLLLGLFNSEPEARQAVALELLAMAEQGADLTKVQTSGYFGRAFGDPDVVVRSYVATAAIIHYLNKGGEKDLLEVDALLGSIETGAKQGAVLGLLKMAEKKKDLTAFETNGYFKKGREDPDPFVRMWAATAFAIHCVNKDGEENIRNAHDLLSSADPVVSGPVAGVMSQFYLDKNNFVGLVSLLGKTDDFVRVRALWKVLNYISSCDSTEKLEELQIAILTAETKCKDELSLVSETADRRRYLEGKKATISPPARAAKTVPPPLKGTAKTG